MEKNSPCLPQTKTPSMPRSSTQWRRFLRRPASSSARLGANGVSAAAQMPSFLASLGRSAVSDRVSGQLWPDRISALFDLAGDFSHDRLGRRVVFLIEPRDGPHRPARVSRLDPGGEIRALPARANPRSPRIADL